LLPSILLLLLSFHVPAQTKLVSNALDIAYNHGYVFSSSNNNVLEHTIYISKYRWLASIVNIATKRQSLLLLVYFFCGDFLTSILVGQLNISTKTLRRFYSIGYTKRNTNFEKKYKTVVCSHKNLKKAHSSFTLLYFWIIHLYFLYGV